MSEDLQAPASALPRQPSIYRPDLFAGRTAFVTGGGTGIGLAIAAELRLLGANVVIGSRRVEKLERGMETLRQIDAPGELELHACNIRDEESIAAAVDFAAKRFGVVDFLVNNGGGQFPSPAIAIARKGWDAVIETNLTGTFLMSQAMTQRVFLQQGHGTIVNIIAQMWNGFPMMAHTGAARSGVDNLTKTLALEWAPMGVRVNAVAPGVILSSGIDNYTPENRKFFFDSVPHIPAGRLGTPREIAAATLFLLSPAAGFITGTTIRVDGGETLYGHAAAQQLKAMVSNKATESYE